MLTSHETVPASTRTIAPLETSHEELDSGALRTATAAPTTSTVDALARLRSDTKMESRAVGIPNGGKRYNWTISKQPTEAVSTDAPAIRRPATVQAARSASVNPMNRTG
jgi:hypothetical protein